jgi:hypothetical protein
MLNTTAEPKPQNAAGTRTKGKSGHGAKSDVVRERAIVELLSGRSFTAAARKAGINERTLRKWASEDDDFKAELRAAQTALFEAGMSRVLGMTTRAVDTLADLLDQGQPPTVRLGAARSILELGVHKHDADDIEKRLGEIETYARQQATGRP